MYFRKTITLQTNSCHNLDPLQMICISFQIGFRPGGLPPARISTGRFRLQPDRPYTMYIDVSLCSKSFKKIAVLSFSKLSFKVVSAYMLPQSSDICLQKSSDMLNKNTLGVKNVRGQSEATCKQAGATKSFDIS